LDVSDPAAASLGLLAFATEEDALRLWAVLPGANPVTSLLATGSFGQILEGLAGLQSLAVPMTHFYQWPSLGSGLCPNGSLALADGQTPYPDADVQARLTAEPAGTVYHYLGDHAVATGVGAVIYSAGVKPGESVAIYGCGGVGLSILQGAKIAGAGPIIAVDRSAVKRELCVSMGATDFVVASQKTADDIRNRTGGRGADWVFEAIGIPSVQESSLDAVRPGGGLVLVGLAPMGTATNFPSSELARTEKRVIGSYYGGVQPRRDFPMLLDWARTGKLNLAPMISRRWKLEEINEAFAEMLKGDVGRGVITF
jgi:NADPH:quinone reductase-like Zn-dependent oxidoreductase